MSRTRHACIGFGEIFLRGCGPIIIADDLDLAPDLPVGVVGHAHPTRFGDAFKAGGDIDAVAEDVVVDDDDVPQR